MCRIGWDIAQVAGGGRERKTKCVKEETGKRRRDEETLGSTKRMEAAGKHDGVVEKGVEFRAHDGA